MMSTTCFWPARWLERYSNVATNQDFFCVRKVCLHFSWYPHRKTGFIYLMIPQKWGVEGMLHLYDGIYLIYSYSYGNVWNRAKSTQKIIMENKWVREYWWGSHGTAFPQIFRHYSVWILFAFAVLSHRLQYIDYILAGRDVFTTLRGGGG